MGAITTMAQHQSWAHTYVEAKLLQ